MRFSVVIPVYNVADYLTACVDSVLSGDCSDYEIILVDDGSTDNRSGPLCDALAARSPGRIRVIHQENLGLGGARNTGLEAARGEYLFFLDGDDTITPDALSTLSRAVETYRHPDVIAFFLELCPEGGGPSSGLQRHSLPAGRVCTLAQHPAMLLDTPSACARLWRRELFLQSGIRYPNHLWYEDLYTTENLLLEAGSVVGLELPLYRYLLRSGSIMRGRDPSRNGEILLALEQVLSWYRRRGCFAQFQEELCGMTLQHISYACYRVLRHGSPTPRSLPQLLAYLTQNFPPLYQIEILPLLDALSTDRSVFPSPPAVPPSCAPVQLEGKRKFPLGGHRFESESKIKSSKQQKGPAAKYLYAVSAHVFQLFSVSDRCPVRNPSSGTCGIRRPGRRYGHYGLFSAGH